MNNNLGQDMFKIMENLYPICRSITGNGVRETLKYLQIFIPLEIKEVPTGTQVFDWNVPKEWNIKDAYIKNKNGEKIIDFKNSNLHVLNYSLPKKGIVKCEELKKHIFTLPDRPDVIPYRTSYYNENWGFCMSHTQFESMQDDEYEVCIDSTLEDGSLTYGEYVIKGELSDEILISTHVCHPSMCNDNLSGIAVSTLFAKELSKTNPRYTYRFLFIPGTIGSLTWLAQNHQNVSQIKHGLVLTGLGDPGNSTYKKSHNGNNRIDKIAEYVLKSFSPKYTVIEYVPFGYDERQYGSPGFDLPVGCLSRSQYDSYPEYHTSADNLSFVKETSLVDSYLKIQKIFHIIENDRTFINLKPYGEPQLGKRGLYKAMGSQSADVKKMQLTMLWVLNQSDSKTSLFDIAIKSGIEFEIIQKVAKLLHEHELLEEVKL